MKRLLERLGERLVYSALVRPIPNGIAVDAEGNAYVTGATGPDLPVTAGAHQSRPGGGICPVHIAGLLSCTDAFVLKLNRDGSSLVYSTYVGGSSDDSAHAIAVDADGYAYIAGETASGDFPVTPGAFQSEFRGRIQFSSGQNFGDAFVTRLDPSGRPVYSTYLTGFGPQEGVSGAFTPSGTLPASLAGTRVLFDGTPAPLLYVAAGQVNAVAPFGVNGTATRITVETPAGTAGPLVLPVTEASPGIFASVLNQDGSLNSPPITAPRGSIVTFYATGAGAMDPPMADGSRAPFSLPLPVPRLDVSVLIGGKPAQILYAGAAPGMVAGALQVNARVPDDADPGAFVPLVLRIGPRASQPQVTIAIR